MWPALAKQWTSRKADVMFLILPVQHSMTKYGPYPMHTTKQNVNNNTSLITKAYRASKVNLSYLQFGSHCALVHKLGVIRTLHNYRAETVISNPINVKPEKDHTRNALEVCGYPNWAFEKAKDKEPKACCTTSQITETSKRGTLVTIPYCTGLSEKVKNIFKSYGISTAFKPVSKLRDRLVGLHVKDRPPRTKQSNLVYGFKVDDTPNGRSPRKDWFSPLCVMI